ncbi:MAG: hypothetical protein AB7S80_10690 [Rhizobiaceae bacterium]
MATPSDFYVPSRGNAAPGSALYASRSIRSAISPGQSAFFGSPQDKVMHMDRFVYGALTLSVYAFVAFLVVV